MALDEFKYFATTREPKLTVEFSSIIKAKDLLRLFREILLGFDKEAKVIIVMEDLLKVRNTFRSMLDVFGSCRFFLLAFFLLGFGGFGD